MRERIVTAALAIALAIVSIPDLVFQARDVDVLLYMAAAARANAEGALPYAAAWIEKGPLAMGLFQSVGALFGPYNFPAIGAMWYALALAGMLLTRATARELSAGRYADLAAVVFIVSIGSVGGAPNTEVPALVAATASLLLWLRTLRTGEHERLAPRALGAGLLAAAALLCRQNAAVLPLILLAAEGVLALRGLRPRAESLRAIAWLSAGVATPSLLVVALYGVTGHFADFLFCFWGYNADIYVAATHVTWERIARSPLTAAENFLLPVPSAAFLGAIGIVLALGRRRGAGPATTAAIALGLTLSMFAGLRFFSHYFALALPFWAALGGYAVSRLAGGLRRAVVAAAVALALWQSVNRTWVDPVTRLKDWVLDAKWATAGDPLTWCGREGFPASVARYIRDEGSPEDRLFVWGKRPHLYVYSGLVPGTRFVTCTFLTGLVPWERVAPHEDTSRWIVPGAWDLLMADLDRDRPRWIVDASRDHLFGGGAYDPAKFPRLAEYLAAHYERVREIGAEGEDRFVVWKRVRE